MAETLNCDEMTQDDATYIEITLCESVSSGKKCDCLPPKKQNSKCKALQSTYPYPPWMPYKHILEHKFRKCQNNCRNAAELCCKLRLQEKCVKKEKERSEKSNPSVWSRLLYHMLGHYIRIVRNKLKAQKQCLKSNYMNFTSYPRTNCSISCRYDEVPHIPAPGWAPRRRFRNLSPPHHYIK